MSIPPTKLECRPFDSGLQKLFRPDSKRLVSRSRHLGDINYRFLTDFLSSLVQVVGPQGPPGPMVNIDQSVILMHYLFFFIPWMCRFVKSCISTAVTAGENPEGLSAMFFRAPQVSRDHVEKLALRVTRWETNRKKRDQTFSCEYVGGA